MTDFSNNVLVCTPHPRRYASGSRRVRVCPAEKAPYVGSSSVYTVSLWLGMDYAQSRNVLEDDTSADNRPPVHGRR